MRAVLIRDKDNNMFQTTGTLKLWNERSPTDQTLNDVFECKTLELPWKENQPQISCIPTGKYEVKPRWSPKYKNHYQIKDVINRSYILIHCGNTYKQTMGCILVGKELKDITWDGIKDVTNSQDTLDRILRVAPQGFKLTII